MSIYSGFTLREHESKYNLTLFDMVLTLAARVSGTLKNRDLESIGEHPAEMRFLRHLQKLHRRMAHFEQNKQLRPYFSQASERLNERITACIGLHPADRNRPS